MNVGVVITSGPGREENLFAVLTALNQQIVKPTAIVVIHDGPEAWMGRIKGSEIRVIQVNMAEKHEPGLEQPRNIGVRALRMKAPECDHVWFLDSDIIVLPNCLDQFLNAHYAVSEAAAHRILIGPYDWLPEPRPELQGDPRWPFREPMPELQNDPRWPSFREHDPTYVSEGKLNDGLACFSGNLIWPIDEFEKIGGFWNEIHHGRCEDGELGLRAVAQGIPISFVPLARGWHLWHPIDVAAAQAKNARDVPMLNARHPWVEGEGVFVVEKDGRRFDQRCPGCGELVNTIEYWVHTETCAGGGFQQRESEELILPEGM